MLLCRRAVALWCAVALAATAAAYTVDCNQEYTDCETELSKLTSEDEDTPLPNSFSNSERKKPPIVRATTTSSTTSTSTTTTTTTTSTERPKTTTEVIESRTEEFMPEIPDEILRPSPRLLFSNSDDLQNFANALHNRSHSIDKKKDLIDLSDVNLDDEEEPVKSTGQIPKHKDNNINDKFYSNLQAPFHPMLVGVSDMDDDTCKENDVTYKVGEQLVRGCEETCECVQGGTFDCYPRCKHPYIRRGRRLNDPLCFESPVDDCCSIIACATGNEGKVTKLEVCRYGNETHTVGAKWFVGCEQSCTCKPNSIVTCQPRCSKLRPSENCINVQDPNDACCEIQVCDVSHDAHEEPENITSSTTTTSTTTTTIAPEIFSNRELPKFHETQTMISKIEPPESKSTMRPLVLAEPIGSVKVLQNNTVQVNLIHANSSEDPIHLQLSSDGGKTFQDVQLLYSDLILNLEGGKDYVIKTKETGTNFNFTITATGNNNQNEVPTAEIIHNITKIGCIQDGQFYDVGEEFHIGCSELCECTGPNIRECAALVCPSHVGLELMSKNCVRWAPNPPAEPPNCCPRAARCLSDGTCHYKGVAIPNWTEVPISITGCEERCFCENGELDCAEACTALPAIPPQTLRCPPLHRPGPVNISDEDCCKQWGCVPIGPMGANFPTHQSLPAFLPTVPPDDRIHFPQEDIADYDQNNIHRPSLDRLPPGLPLPAIPFGDDNKRLSVLSMQADSPSSVKMLFGLPSVLVGLRGSVDLRYTDQADDDISHWHSQVFAPTDEVLTTPRLEFTLSGLKPSTTYKIRGKLFLHNLPVEPESEIRVVRTLDPPKKVTTTEEKRREVDSSLSVTDVNDTVAHVSWRHFTEEELQLIDGIQVRYRPIGTPIYSMTELLHHGRSSAELHDLRPGTRYEASLVLVPPPRASTELHDPGRVEFTTSPYVDPYNWTVTIEARAVGSEAAELTWRGVPSPAERWVRVYRAAHACGATSTSVRREHDAFRLAARDLPPAVTLTGLEPNTRCRVWLELFLTNGKVKTSNVIEINTKSQDSPEPIDNEIESASVAGSRTSRGDYYSALVVVGVVAALGALTSLLLLLVVVRRHHTRSVAITPTPTAPRESSLPPYDNPAYKLELQQETMDL